MRAVAVSLLSIALMSCSAQPVTGDIRVGIVGSGFRTTDPERGTLSPSDALLTAATTQGLVRFDATGQVEPALAESWIVTADGTSIIFRLHRTAWPNGDEVIGDEVADSVARAMRPGSRNRLAPLLTAVDAALGMTGRVVEIRMKVPRPNLLQLLAQPELGIRRGGQGLGPYKVMRRTSRAIRLSLVAEPDEDVTSDDVVLRSERVALGVARFVAGDLHWLAGGTLGDLAVAQAADLRPGRLRFDPVQGLFGLAIVGRKDFLRDADIRSALSIAIEREALGSAVNLPGWSTSAALLPAQLDSADSPARLDVLNGSFAQRRDVALTAVARWREQGRPVPTLRVALPEGFGYRPLFAKLAADWAAIGVTAERVALDARDADLRLIDAVAPNSSANWYLTSVSCAAGLVCDAQGDAALKASREAATLAERSRHLAEADAAAARRASFIPLGVPVRWSLVDPSLIGWKENVFAAHPLIELRPPRR